MDDGFLGYHTSLMLDVVVCALVLVVPVLAVSLWLVKSAQRGSLREGAAKEADAERPLEAGPPSLSGISRLRRRYLWHRNLQITLGVLLLLAVSAFEVDLRLHGGWEKIVNKPSRPVRLAGDELEFARRVLWGHLVFAVSTPILWGTTLVWALRRFPSPPRPAAHSRLHKVLGWASTVDLVLTSFTGLAFYYVAFMRPG